jgi:Ca2+-binding RTX toxin-like protein
VLSGSGSGFYQVFGASRWTVLSGMERLVLNPDAGGYFDLTFNNSSLSHNHVKSFEIVASALDDIGQTFRLSAGSVTNTSFWIDGTLGGYDTVKTGKGNDTFVYSQDALDVNDTIDAGGGNNTLVFAGAGKVEHVRDGPDIVSPNGHSYLAHVEDIDRIVVTNLKATQSRDIEFGTVASAQYTGSGIISISTNANFGEHKAAAEIAGTLIINGARLKAGQVLHVLGGDNDDQLTGGGGADRLFGGSGDDHLYGGSSADVLAGGSGKDWLFGNYGADRLTGNGGADMFVFTQRSDSTVAAKARDIITDFSHQDGDQINLSFDTGGGPIPGSNLSFIGAKTFSHHAGEVRDFVYDGNTIVQVDATGDAKADFELILLGKMNLTGDDFSP